MLAVASGLALAFKLQRAPRVALTWVGDGSTKAGIFHEAMNLAAVQRLPLIVIIQNNQVALGTRLDQHHRGSFLEWPAAYGVEGSSFDGNNVLDAYAAVKLAADGCRQARGPYMLIGETFRMGGHATHDEREARATFPAQLFEHWGKRDPIGLFETYLIGGDIDLERNLRAEPDKDLRERNELALKSAEQRVIAEIEAAIEQALESGKSRQPRPESAAIGAYAGASTDDQTREGVGPARLTQ
jgi:TPP-dependent pyruvate/acetoin dehydrogenase alpha subunit